MSFDRGQYPRLEPLPQAREPTRRMPTLIKALQQQESLRAVIESISSELALRPLLTSIVRHACDLLDAWDGAIGLYDPRQDLVRIEACYRMPENELGAEFRPGVGLAGQVLAERRPVTFDAYREVPQPTRDDRSDFAVVGVPISWQDRLIGVFGIGAPAPRRFADRDIEALTLFGRHAAIAIQNAQRYEGESERAQRWALVARVGKLITSGLELGTLLQTAADAIHETLGYPNIAIALVDRRDPSRLRIDAVGGRYKKLLAGTFYMPLASGIMGAAVRDNRVERVADVSRDRRYVPTPGTAGIRASLAIPLQVHDEVLGAVNVESDRPLSDDDTAGLQVVADHLAVAIENARLFERAQTLAAIEERQRLARELHDSVSQRIFSTSLLAQSIAPTWQRDPRAGERLVEQVVTQSRQAQVEMRALLNELRPPETDDEAADPAAELATPADRRGSLLGALAGYARELEQHELTVAFDSTGYRPQAAVVEDAIYRIAREALHNVVKHAAASRVQIRLHTHGSRTVLEVIDDGVGPSGDPTSPPQPGKSGLGIGNMRQRAAELGGRCDLLTAPQGGAILRAELPASAEEISAS